MINIAANVLISSVHWRLFYFQEPMTEYKSLPNYFEFYHIPVAFNPDLNAIKLQFYANSKKYHPDFFANESDEKQQEVLELSTLNNKAYQVLTSPQRRLKYVLELLGIVETDEGYKLPQDFLMDMMDINEALMDLEFEPDAAKINQLKEDVAEIAKGLDHELEHLTQAYDTSNTDKESVLATIKDIFYRQKYVARIQEKLQQP
ncbi:molecular chaperone HscB [Pedobacter rhizosphaerae]|uniref:Molecular chaperone HscB n=2 Tax=Pedobacter rhizosphaerae TaxID=390241 RepID=A0A1H9MTM9_9SPHI|nr:molecular chaperone HscB [Pedobacter rhizosphaerae]